MSCGGVEGRDNIWTEETEDKTIKLDLATCYKKAHYPLNGI